MSNEPKYKAIEVPGAITGPRFVRSGWRMLLAVTAALLLGGSVCAPAPDDHFAQAVAGLAADNFPDKAAAVTALSELRHPRSRAVLVALLDGKLYARVADNKVFITDGSAASLALIDPLTLAAAGSGKPDDFSRITTNNSLRKTLRSAVASFALADPEPDVRLAAVKEMLRSLDEDSVAVLRAGLEKEKDAHVQQAMRAGLALVDLDNSDAQVRLAAAQSLKGTLNPDVYNRLSTMITPAADGSYPEPDLAVRNAARAVIASIDSSRRVYSTVETLFFGLSLGSVLVLAAIGLAITFGVMGVINMAHGELMMLGAYCTYGVQWLLPNQIGASVLIAIPLAFLVAGLVGVIIERTIVRFLYGRPLETLLATFGVSLILQQIVRDRVSANNVPVETPAWMSGSLQINEALSFTYNRIYVLLFMVIVFTTLQIVMKKTTLGLKVRAVAQNRNMARAMGVRTQWVDAMTFGLGSGIAGVAGVALSQLTNVGPNLGQQYIIDSFMVVVFGGVGNLWGTLVSGLSLGIVNKVLEPWAGAVLAKVFVLVALILFVQRRPRGLFPQKGRAAEG